MPTILPRIQVTATPPVAEALRVAAEQWPDLPRSEQIARLLNEGAKAVSAAAHTRRVQRTVALHESAGIVAYPQGYLEDLRDEWPA